MASRLSAMTLRLAAASAVVAVVALGCGARSALSTSGGTASGAGGAGPSTSSASSSSGSTTSTTSSTSASSTTSSSGTGGTGGADAGPLDVAFQTATTIAADDDGNAVACWVAFLADGSSAIQYTTTHDGGATWSPPGALAAPGGRRSRTPAVAAHGQGRFSLGWVGFHAEPPKPDAHVYVSQLQKGTEVFGAPVVASDDGIVDDRAYGQPSLAVDAGGDLVLTWLDESPGGPPSLVFARTSDGISFQHTLVGSGASVGDLGRLCLDPAQGPWASLFLFHAGPDATVSMRKSNDRGLTWTLAADGLDGAEGAVFQSAPCVSFGDDEVELVYAKGTALFSSNLDAPATSVVALYSHVGGAEFGGPVLPSDGTPGTLYLFPQLARTPSGALAVIYYQGTVGVPASLMLSVSTDILHWGPAKKIADAGTFTVERTAPTWLGDDLGLAAAGGSLYVSYAENTQGMSRVKQLVLPAP